MLSEPGTQEPRMMQGRSSRNLPDRIERTAAGEQGRLSGKNPLDKVRGTLPIRQRSALSHTGPAERSSLESSTITLQQRGEFHTARQACGVEVYTRQREEGGGEYRTPTRTGKMAALLFGRLGSQNTCRAQTYPFLSMAWQITKSQLHGGTCSMTVMMRPGAAILHIFSKHDHDFCVC